VSGPSVPRGWKVAICQPEAPLAEGCQPTVLSRYLYRVAGDLRTYDGSRYRGMCFGCAWRGPERDSENNATEDAHDHVFPEWRSLPAIEPYRYDDQAKRARLAQRFVALYPAGWSERHGPTGTCRDTAATRHVPGGGLFGGYCMSRLRRHDHRDRDDAEQLDLFAI
jgi:Family of unknown function (DUF6349)